MACVNAQSPMTMWPTSSYNEVVLVDDIMAFLWMIDQVYVAPVQNVRKVRLWPPISFVMIPRLEYIFQILIWRLLQTAKVELGQRKKGVQLDHLQSIEWWKGRVPARDHTSMYLEGIAQASLAFLIFLSFRLPRVIHSNIQPLPYFFDEIFSYLILFLKIRNKNYTYCGSFFCISSPGRIFKVWSSNIWDFIFGKLRSFVDFLNSE